MSYILAALKKSELEREQLIVSSDAIPVSTGPDLGSPSKKSSLFSGRFIVYLLMGLALVLVVLYLSSKYTASPAPIMTELFIQKSLNSELGSVPVVDEQVSSIQVSVAKVMKAKAREESVSDQEYMIEDKSVVLRIEQASELTLAKIPNISITSHIYSSQAKRRSIVVNDERLVEGDFVATQVQVQEITPQGMVLNVNGSLLAVSRSRGWNR